MPKESLQQSHLATNLALADGAIKPKLEALARAKEMGKKSYEVWLAEDAPKLIRDLSIFAQRKALAYNEAGDTKAVAKELAKSIRLLQLYGVLPEMSFENKGMLDEAIALSKS